MDDKELIKMINKSVENLDLVSARRYIEGNIELLQENRHLLDRNARELFNYLNEKSEDTLSREEMNVVLSINTCASRFDVRGLKFLLANHPDLFLRDDLHYHLTSDAKVILEGMNAITVD